MRRAIEQGVRAGRAALARGLGSEGHGRTSRRSPFVSGFLRSSIVGSYGRPASPIKRGERPPAGGDFDSAMRGHDQQDVYVTVAAEFAQKAEQHHRFVSAAIRALNGRVACRSAVEAAEKAARRAA